MNTTDREVHTAVRSKARRHLIPAMLIALCVVVIFFTLYEIVEYVWFGDADTNLLHSLHITRGVLASFITALMVGWVIKRAEKSLKQSEARYRAIVENQTELVCRWLPDGTLTFVNDSYCRYFGRTREELLGHKFLPLIPQEDQAAVRTRFDTLNPDSPVATHTHRVIAAGGELRWQQWTNHAFYDKHGHMTELQGLGQDITERKLAEEALRESESRFRTLFENSEVSIWNEDMSEVHKALEQLRLEGVTDLRQYLMDNPQAVWDMAASIRVIHVNEATLKQFGAKSEDQLLNQIDKTFGPNVIEVFIEELCAIWEDKRTFRAEAAYRTLDGRDITAIISFRIPETAEGFRSIPVSILDITERKRAEEALRESEERYLSLSEASFEGLMIHDRGRVIDANTRIQGMFGYSLEELIKMSAFELVAPEDRELVQQNVAEGKEGSYEAVGLRKDSTTFPMELQARRMLYRGRPMRVVACQDISPRKRAEEALKRSEARYRAIVEVEPECVKLLDAEGRILEMNPAGLKLIGVESFDEIKGQSIYDLISPQYLDAYRKLHADIFRGIPGTLEYEIIRLNGEHRFVHTSAVPMHDTDGNISAHLAITRDTTEQHRILKRLELTQFAVDNSSISTFWVQKDGRFAYVNDAACRKLGYSREELLRLTVSDIDPVFTQEKWPEHWAEMKKASTVTFEGLHRSKDGQVYPVEITTNYMKYEDEEYIWAFSADISKRKQAQDDLVDREARLQAIVETAAEGIVTIDEQGIIQSFNRSSERIFGYSAGEVIGRTINLLMPKTFAVEHDRIIQNYLKTGSITVIGIGREVTALRKDGTTFPMDLSVSETVIGDTRLFTGLCRDITDRVEMERQRTMLEVKLLQAQKIEAVGNLATGVAHDISNSLTAILGYTALLREKYTDEPNIIETIRGIDLASNMSLDVAQSLLTFSRKGEIDKERINLAEITSAISNLLKRLLPSSIQLHINIDHESDPIWISGNAHQIQRVLINLAVNAQDAMPEGGSLSISFRRISNLPPKLAQMVESPQSEYVCIEVSDTGVGMNSKTLASIYDPFFTTKVRGQGTGLGMSIVHGIISDHHGLINIESAPGEGTQVSIYLPLLPAATSVS